MIIKNMTELIGGTPMLSASRFALASGVSNPLLLKLEYLNPAGSVKDRVALKMITDAENTGKLQPDYVIIEATSGNTGIGLAAAGAAKGYKVVLTMPDSVSAERIKLLLAYGAEIVLTPGKDGMHGAAAKAMMLHRETENSFLTAQFENPSNPLTHYETTGPEIYAQTNGELDVFLAGIGTGGTITGVGRYLKEKNAEIRIIGVEPASSPLLTQNRWGSHELQGIGANFVPQNYDAAVVDFVITVTEEEAYAASKLLAKTEGILTGITSGAALAAAVRLQKTAEFAEKRIVVLLPDSGDRYFSTPLFS